MKKLFFLVPIFLLSFSGYTRDLGAAWLVTGNCRLDCRKIHLGYKNARIMLEKGEKKIIPINSIQSYSLNERIYTRLPLYTKGDSTGMMVFMELVNTYGEFGMYRLEEKVHRPFSHSNKIVHYFLYKGEKLNWVFDEKSLPKINVQFVLVNSYK